MSTLAIVEVMIGLAFVYLLLSLICTIINEWIAQLASLRSKNLQKGIQQLLADENMKGLASKIYDHPFIKNLSPTGGKPSYISGETFARVLVDVIDPNAKDAQSTSDAIKSVKNSLTKADVPDNVKRSVLAMIDQGTESLEDLRKNIQVWFDDTMDRVSGWYKRWMRAIALVIAFLVAGLSNADTLMIAKSLWEDPSLRVATADLAKQEVEKCKDQVFSECIEKKNYNEIQEHLRPFPIGWQETRSRNTLPFMIIGWLITALAVSLGAPFWFDALNKLNSIRAAGSKPRKMAERKE